MRWNVWDRGWWRPKPDSFVTEGRAIHSLLSFMAMIVAGAWGYQALAIASIGMLTLGWLWEAASPILGWRHPWGDILDFVAFEVGQIAGVLTALAVYGMTR